MSARKRTAEQVANSQAYEQCKPEQFGNMHERMKYLIECAQEARQSGGDLMDVWHLMFDLEREVRYYMPIDPPFVLGGS